MTTEFEKWIAIGQSLKLDGVELRDFVIGQQNTERDRRAQERATAAELEAKKIEDAAEQRKFAAELEVKKAEIEIQAQIELEQRKIEAEQKKIEMQNQMEERRFTREASERSEQLRINADLERQKLDIEARRIQLQFEGASRASSEVSMSEQHSFNRAMNLKMIPFDEKNDDLDVYLGHFERVCTSYGIQHSEWAIQLSRHLKGTALEVFQRVPSDQVNDYEGLKHALLKRFSLTEGGYRKRFKTSKVETGESVGQFVSRLRGYLTKWREFADLEPTYEGLETLLLKDQFFGTCSKELRVHLKEKGKMSLDEMTKCAENYLEAHADDNPRSTSGNPSWNGKPKNESKKFDHSSKSQMESYRKDPMAGEGNSKGACYNCGSTQHQMKTCPKNKMSDKWKSPVKCFGCGKTGHRMSECRNAKKNMHSAGAMNVFSSATDEIPKVSKIETTIQRQEGSCESNNRRQMCGHRGQDCDVTLTCGCRLPVVASACSNPEVSRTYVRMSGVPTRQGFVNGEKVIVMRDSGCSTAVCRTSLVRQDQYTGSKEACVLIDGVVKYFPTALIEVRSPFFSGVTKCLVMDHPLHDVIIGNIEGARVPTSEDFSEEVKTIDEVADVETTVEEAHQTSHEEVVIEVTTSSDTELSSDRSNDRLVTQPEVVIEKETSQEDDDITLCAAVTTRSMTAKEDKPPRLLKVTPIEIDSVTVDEFRKLQAEDETLQKLWELARKEETGHGKADYVIRKGLLYRRFHPGKDKTEIMQLVVPGKLRNRVLEVAHDGLLSGHLSNKKTLDRVTSSFHWPGVNDSVKRYVWSCDRCQRNVYKGSVAKAPLGKLPLIGIPFSVICLDIIGPIKPASDRGNRYILSMIDMGSRYPDAVALKDISTASVADGLLEFYSRYGIPTRIHTDCGSNFRSEMMAEVNRLLSIRASSTSPYHCMGNGLAENLNRSIRNSLKKMTSERVRDWDRYLNPLLFALRDVPHASTGFSSFELLFGRNVRGPTTILKELWSEEIEEPELKTTYQYVVDLREKIEETCKLAQEEIAKVQVRNKKYFDRRTRLKDLKPGDLALLLLPTDNNKLLLHWRGPYRVVSREGEVDYKIEMASGQLKTFHANMLKRYREREESTTSSETNGVEPASEAAAIVSVIDDIENVNGTEIDTSDGEMLPLYNAIQKETIADVVISPHLSKQQRYDIDVLLKKYEDIFTDVPKVTNLIEHHIKLTNTEPIHCKMYPLPYKLQEVIDKEIEEMERLSVVEPSEAAYSFPLVIVKKADGSNRPCVNYKALNAVTVFDPEPMMTASDIFPKLASSKVYSKFDCSKGYWQIPMAEESKDYTSFSTIKGQKRFRVMPFGLINASSTFNRCMRKMLEGSKGLENYLDDVLCHTDTWKDHLKKLEDFFQRVRRANISLRPSKCHIGFEEIEFLGHVLTGNAVEPRAVALEKILAISRPTTKKQVRALLGMVNFYRQFIPGCAKLTAPLSDLTSKRARNVVEWTDRQEQSFVKLKQLLSQGPILKLPDLNKQFVLRTDASDENLGSCLLQETDGILYPVAYASRKLLSRERNYTVGEKECLAIVWSVQKFGRYLINNPFILETDHRPLECLNTLNTTNPRIMRWGLALQTYQFTVRYIRGCDNIIADSLSRV
jgi:hypothetical protein